MNSERERLLKSYIPMTEPSFLLLQSLDQPRHGYGIMQSVAQATGGRVSLGASTVYTILYKMEQDKLIEVCSEVDRRKVYRITQTGAEILKAESIRILQLAALANRTLEELGELARA